MAFRELQLPETEQDPGFGLLQLIPLLVALGGKAIGNNGVKLDQKTGQGQVLGKYLDIKRGGNGANPVEAVKASEPAPPILTKRGVPKSAAPAPAQMGKSQDKLLDLIRGKG